MNRTERLYGLAEELRRVGDRGRRCAALAAMFEVSERTIKRDISALQYAGLPIWAEQGRLGGYRFLETKAELPAVTFTSGEAAALAIALGTQRDLPFASEGSTALGKILNSMNATDRRQVADLLERVGSTTAPVRTRAARTIDEAIRRQIVVNISYIDRDGTTTDRRIDPIQYAHVAGRWYLHAYCHLRKGGRWFRLDRIRSARLTRSKAPQHDHREVIGTPPPEAASLASRWRVAVE